jgi:cytosine/adenosine deaminase-related metal-dependent hydrolase
LAENERYARACAARKDNRFAAMIGAHASFTMEENSLASCADLSNRLKVGVHIHAAEDTCDEQLTRERFGCGLMERFRRTGLLETHHSIFSHCTHFSDEDFAIVNERQASTGLSVAHNPSSNMNNGVGYTPVAKLRQPPQLGTDGIGADMWREARVAEFKSHDSHLAIPFGQSLEMLGQSARVASKALGITLGVIEPGAAADLVLTNYRPATPLASDNLAGHLLFAMGPEFVRDVMVSGWWLMRKGHIVTCDDAAIRSRAVVSAQKLYERMQTLY